MKAPTSFSDFDFLSLSFCRGAAPVTAMAIALCTPQAGDDEEDRFDRMEKLIEKAMKRMTTSKGGSVFLKNEHHTERYSIMEALSENSNCRFH